VDIVELFLGSHRLGRDKDWTDLRSMAATGTEVDLAVVEDLLIRLRGPSMYPRVARGQALFEPG
jgi:hypothetical protein